MTFRADIPLQRASGWGLFFCSKKILTFAVVTINLYLKIMSVAIVEVPFQADLLQQVDRFVDEKVCSRADIILEATKMYIARKQNWQNLFSLGDRLSMENNLSEIDVLGEIKAYRSEKR